MDQKESKTSQHTLNEQPPSEPKDDQASHEAEEKTSIANEGVLNEPPPCEPKDDQAPHEAEEKTPIANEGVLNEPPPCEPMGDQAPHEVEEKTSIDQTPSKNSDDQSSEEVEETTSTVKENVLFTNPIVDAEFIADREKFFVEVLPMCLEHHYKYHIETKEEFLANIYEMMEDVENIIREKFPDYPGLVEARNLLQSYESIL